MSTIILRRLLLQLSVIKLLRLIAASLDPWA